MKLEPCPFCSAQLDVVESLAKAFQPPKPYIEFHHPRGQQCQIKAGILWAGEKGKEMAFLEMWNRRTPPASQSDDLQSRVFTGPMMLSSEEALVDGDAPDEITQLKTQLSGAWKEVERQEHLVKVYRQAQLDAEAKLCREQQNATGWKNRTKYLETREAAAHAAGRAEMREEAALLVARGHCTNGDEVQKDAISQFAVAAATAIRALGDKP